MSEEERLQERLFLLADVLWQSPENARTLLSALEEEERRELLCLLDKLGGAAEALYAPGQEESAPESEALPDVELGENEMLCVDCEQFCRVSWEEDGSIHGARCACGYQAVQQVLKSKKTNEQGTLGKK